MPTLEKAIHPDTQTPEPVLDIAQVMELTRRKRTSIYTGMKAKTFPAAIKLGTRTFWFQREIAAHLASAPRFVSQAGQGA
jgi:predicted DNA-binding transcriptional regulator AlpA